MSHPRRLHPPSVLLPSEQTKRLKNSSRTVLAALLIPAIEFHCGRRSHHELLHCVWTQPRSGGAFLCADRGTIPRAPNCLAAEDRNPSANMLSSEKAPPLCPSCGAFSLRRRQHSHAQAIRHT